MVESQKLHRQGVWKNDLSKRKTFNSLTQLHGAEHLLSVYTKAKINNFNVYKNSYQPGNNKCLKMSFSILSLWLPNTPFGALRDCLRSTKYAFWRILGSSLFTLNFPIENRRLLFD